MLDITNLSWNNIEIRQTGTDSHFFKRRRIVLVLDTGHWTLDNVDPVKPQDLGGRWCHNPQDTEILIKTSLYRNTGHFTQEMDVLTLASQYS